MYLSVIRGCLWSAWCSSRSHSIFLLYYSLWGTYCEGKSSSCWYRFPCTVLHLDLSEQYLLCSSVIEKYSQLQYKPYSHMRGGYNSWCTFPAFMQKKRPAFSQLAFIVSGLCSQSWIMDKYFPVAWWSFCHVYRNLSNFCTYAEKFWQIISLEKILLEKLG